jgi:FixJ family two-component response regulator
MKLGAYDYLMKPCEMDILMTKVADAAARKRQQENKIVEARLKEITRRRA